MMYGDRRLRARKAGAARRAGQVWHHTHLLFTL